MVFSSEAGPSNYRPILAPSPQKNHAYEHMVHVDLPSSGSEDRSTTPMAEDSSSVEGVEATPG